MYYIVPCCLIILTVYFCFKVISPEDKYEIQRVVEEAALVVRSIAEDSISVTITLTSPIMREQLLQHEGGK